MLKRFRMPMLILTVVCGIFSFLMLGFIEGGVIPPSMMTLVGGVYLLGLASWLYLTLSARTWAGRLGGFIILSLGFMLLYCYLNANVW